MAEQTQTMMSTVTVPADGLTALIMAIFGAAGAGGDEARAIAENLVDANLSGHDSHGVIRVPRYFEAERAGHVRFGQKAKLVLETESMAVLDGGHGFGQVLGRQAVSCGIEKAGANGIALVALRNAGHLGRIGVWAELAAEAGFVSIHFVNVACSNLVAPFGGADRRMSTAPVTIGVVNPQGDDFILDFATSKVAEGKILLALKSGKLPPEGSLVDSDGQPTQDPHALYGPVPPGTVPNPRGGSGALVAMGDHKGSGLALACELLAGALTGSGTTGPGDRVHNGMLSIFISPKAIDDGHDFAGSVNAYIDFVQACQPVDPSKPVMIPGDPERAARRDRLANGVPLALEAWQNILDAGRSLGITQTQMDAMCPPVSAIEKEGV